MVIARYVRLRCRRFDRCGLWGFAPELIDRIVLVDARRVFQNYANAYAKMVFHITPLAWCEGSMSDGVCSEAD